MSEMKKLRKALDDAGIPWVDHSYNPWGWSNIVRTRFINNQGIEVSVICGEGTYGGYAGLLETMPRVHSMDEDDPMYDEVEGYLTADEIIAFWL